MTDQTKYADLTTDELETLRSAINDRKHVIRVQLDEGTDRSGRRLGKYGEDRLQAELVKVSSLSMSLGRVVNRRYDLGI